MHPQYHTPHHATRPLTRKIELFILYYFHVFVLVFAFIAGMWTPRAISFSLSH